MNSPRVASRHASSQIASAANQLVPVSPADRKRPAQNDDAVTTTRADSRDPLWLLVIAMAAFFALAAALIAAD
jgi:hypothetical protein